MTLGSAFATLAEVCRTFSTAPPSPGQIDHIIKQSTKGKKIMKYGKGALVMDTEGGTRKVLGICGDLYLLSGLQTTDSCTLALTEAGMDARDYTLLMKEPAPEAPQEDAPVEEEPTEEIVWVCALTYSSTCSFRVLRLGKGSVICSCPLESPSANCPYREEKYLVGIAPTQTINKKEK